MDGTVLAHPAAKTITHASPATAAATAVLDRPVRVRFGRRQNACAVSIAMTVRNHWIMPSGVRSLGDAGCPDGTVDETGDGINGDSCVGTRRHAAAPTAVCTVICTVVAPLPAGIEAGEKVAIEPAGSPVTANVTAFAKNFLREVCYMFPVIGRQFLPPPQTVSKSKGDPYGQLSACSS